MKATEIELEQNIFKQFKAVAKEGLDIIGFNGKPNTAEIINKINEFLTSFTFDGKADDFDSWTDVALPVGTLWGEQLITEFGWEWIKVKFENDSVAIGVFSQDRSVGVYPWYFVLGCIENDATVTIALAWNMLKEGKIPKMKPNEFQNLMDGVHYLVPPKI